MAGKYKKHEVKQADEILGIGMKIGVVVSEWNEDITFRLRDACTQTLLAHGVSQDNIIVSYVPGAFELPLGARFLLLKEKLDGIVCLGCVIKGETKHDEYIAKAVATGIMSLGLTSGKPIIFGVLTPNDHQQALARADGSHGNKGEEAAITVLKMVALGKQAGTGKKGIGF